MNSINNLARVFHPLIIAIFLLSLSACGYKAPPYYTQEPVVEDENVEFILKEEKNADEN